jgi:eukaryotic-like serine/threonine-protein kinase
MQNGPPPRDPGLATLGRGASIGRYVVLGLVGRGGMGEVYAAYDPELDRKVAVKLLRIKPGNGVPLTEGRQRTLREAQAIARLSHPNVVVVYDVGTFQDQVFIAMEFLDGNTLAYWLQAQPRTWQEILKVFVAAGSGLQAAHDKGLVHRDFKPDNVMIGRDGQVRVMDFGLARQVSDKPQIMPRMLPPRQHPAGEGQLEAEIGSGETIVLHAQVGAVVPSDSASPPAGLFDERLTRTGAMMGTPAYMAPEQFFGAATDARTDQFSFCVALYEALYDERPFAGNNMTTLTGNVVQGSVREPPAGSKVPLWLRRVVLRGLRPQIVERYPTMGELIVALGKSPYAARRRAVIIAAAVLLPIAFGFGVRQSLADHRALCGGATEKLSDVWELPPPGQPEPPRQARIHGAFLRSGKSYAADVYATASRALSAYAQSWANMYHETCEATQVRHEQSDEVLDLRMSCLQERLGGLRALTNVFIEADGDVVENAVSATNALASLDRCADVPLLRAVIRPPEDPATRARVAELRKRLAGLKARFDAGRWKESLKNAPALVAEARAVGYQPLVAESLSLMGMMLAKGNDSKQASEQAERTLIEAFSVADASRHDEVRAEAAANLVFVVGYEEAHFGEAHSWAKAAEAVLDRLGGHDLLRAWLLNDLGCVLELEGKREEAVRVDQQSVALKERVLGAFHPDVGISEVNLAISLQELGRNDEALSHNDRAIRLLTNGLGAEHPDIAMPLSDGGEILNALNRYQEGRVLFERAEALREREFGRNDRMLAYQLTGIGIGYLGEGKAAAALMPLERALKIREAQEPELTRRAETQFALARALWESHRGRVRARLLADQARQLYLNSSERDKSQEIDGWLKNHGAN